MSDLGCGCCMGGQGGEPTPSDCLRAEVERLRSALRGAIGMVEMLGVPLSYSGQAELDGYRRALEAKAERPGPPYDAAYEQNKRRR